MPEILFKLDTSIEEGSRILNLINQVEQAEGVQAPTVEAE
jgi:ribosome-binding factor A